MLHKKFGIYCLTETSSNIYLRVNLSTCKNKVSSGENCRYFYWCIVIVRKGCSKILRLRNPLEVSVDFNLVIYDSSLSNFLLLIHAWINSGQITVY